MHINFDAFYQEGKQVCTRNQENTNCTFRLSLLWRAKAAILMRWRTIYTSAHTQVFKIHQKYIKLIYVFGSAHVKIDVWIHVGPQPLFPAEPRVKNDSADPNYISRFETIQTPYFKWT